MTALIVIGGPTASGKSALALLLAEAVRGMIINADSMQLYRDLRILTARPTPEDEARVPHRLYGVLDAEDPASAGRWLELAGIAIGEARAEGRPAIVVGGTGLYLHALLHGIAPVPEIPAAVQSDTSARFAALGAPAFHAELAKRDPAMAARLRPSDRQRLIRAYEVVVGTGRSLAAWQAAPPVRVELPMPRIGIALTPPRAALYERIRSRLHEMIERGALAELEGLRRRCLDPELPLMKAVAVPELLAHLEGRVDLATALDRAIVQTRRYAKRQLTWLRHQLPELRRLETFGDAADLPTSACAGPC
jgi:tRNA dimethylallyltransferase